MNLRNRVLAAGLGVALVMVMGRAPLVAQEPSGTAPSEPTKARTYDPTRRVPSYFGQVGLTPEQRETIYKIVAKHQQKIETLQKQLADERTSAIKECEGVLNDQQKQLLELRRQSAPRRKSSAANVPAKPATPAPEGSSH